MLFSTKFTQYFAICNFQNKAEKPDPAYLIISVKTSENQNIYTSQCFFLGSRGTNYSRLKLKTIEIGFRKLTYTFPKSDLFQMAKLVRKKADAKVTFVVS